MKKLTALILILVLCLGLAVPAAAAVPETGAEAAKKYSIATTMSACGERVELEDEGVNLYCDDGESFWLTDTFSSVNIISSGSFISVANTGSEDDYFVWADLEIYIKNEDGLYVLDYPNDSLSLRECGFVTCIVFDDMDGTHREQVGEYEEGLVRLNAGEYYMFRASDLYGLPGRNLKEKDCLYKITIYQYYPDGTGAYDYWYRSNLYKIDDAKAKELAAANGKESEFENISALFDDVASQDYYHVPVNWAFGHGVTTGVSHRKFEPFTTCNRGQVVTFLWRSMGSPEPITTVNPFTDIKESDFFYKAALWAYENGITTGATATTFDPNGKCTSGQVITFLWRTNGKPAAEHSGSEFYAEAVAWAEADGLLQIPGKTFVPADACPRADIVTYLYRNWLK